MKRETGPYDGLLAGFSEEVAITRKESDTTPVPDGSSSIAPALEQFFDGFGPEVRAARLNDDAVSETAFQGLSSEVTRRHREL